MTHHITDEQIFAVADEHADGGHGPVGAPADWYGFEQKSLLECIRAVLALAAPQGQPVAYRIDYPGVTDTVGLRRWCGADEYASFRQTIEFLGGVFVPLYTAPAPAVPEDVAENAARWVNAADRKPEAYVDVLIRFDDGSQRVGRVNQNGDWQMASYQRCKHQYLCNPVAWLEVGPIGLRSHAPAARAAEKGGE